MYKYQNFIYRSPRNLQNEIKEKYELNKSAYSLVEVVSHHFLSPKGKYYFLIDKEDNWVSSNVYWYLQLVKGYQDITFHVITTRPLDGIYERHLSRIIIKKNRKIPNGKKIKFLNLNQFDCTKKNLQIASTSSVHAARRGDKNTTSIFKGLSPYKRNSSENGWRAYLTVEGERYYLGAYHYELEAAYAYNICLKFFYSKGCLLNSYKNRVIGEITLDKSIKRIKSTVKDVKNDTERLRSILEREIKAEVLSVSAKNRTLKANIKPELTRHKLRLRRDGFLKDLYLIIQNYSEKGQIDPYSNINDLVKILNKDKHETYLGKRWNKRSLTNSLNTLHNLFFS